MRITIVLGAFFPVPTVMGGAIEKIWLALATEFARHGHEVMLISRKVDQFPERELRDGVNHVRVAGFNSPTSALLLKFYDLVYSLRVRKVLRPSDVVVTNTFWLPFFRKGAYVHVGRYPKGQTQYYRKAVRLQAPSRAVGEAIAQEAPEMRDRIKVIPYPAPQSCAKAEPPPIGDRQDIILYVGRLHPEKGVHLLVQAFTAVRTLSAQWKLMIVGPANSRFGGGGDAYLQSLQRLAAGHSNVIFAGEIFDEKVLEETFRRAKIFVYPSLAERGESFGLAPLEAMTHGCAVVVSSLDCFRDFVTDNETGFVFDHRVPDAAAALSDRLEEAAADGERLARISEAGRQRSGDYRLDRVASQFLIDFREVTAHA